MSGISMATPKAILLDIEFPYALEALPNVCRTKWSDPEFQDYVRAFPADAQDSPEALIEHVQDLTRRDVKVACLKNLQGYLWKDGYEGGAYSTPLFRDVVPFLKLQHSRQPAPVLAIYSSGSVPAQKLLASYVQKADGKSTEDIKPLFSAYFDTTNAGLKLESSSYEKIVSELGIDANHVHFFTDNVKEAEASHKAGLVSFLFVRPGNPSLPDEILSSYKSTARLLHSFEELPYA